MSSGNPMNFDELYREVILDHCKRPRNFGPLPQATATAHGDNPSCGDEVHLGIVLSPEGVVEDIKFTGQACAISTASTSLMTTLVKGKKREEAEALLKDFENMICHIEETKPPASLGNLRALAGVRQFPQRVKCAMLGWRALEQTLDGNSSAPKTITTEEPSS